MDVFAGYLAQIDDPAHRARMQEVLSWVHTQFPQLEARIAWKQPMFTDHGTFIIGFSVARNHLALAPELAGIVQFNQDILRAGYAHSKLLVRFPWDRPFDFALAEKMIDFNLLDKANCSTFWREARNIDAASPH